jgi:sugar lactone lactonase YvrE/enterochelin esterase-like enzyme
VYVPAQYDGSKPACVMIFQDGGGMVTETGSWRAPVVMDNLIAKREMPVTIGIFINPGVLPAAGEGQQGRYNRSYEYDALGDRYARFLIEEILPEVGKTVKLSADPNDRALMGSSSGASAAFTAAWTRPDAFRRVMSFIGSYTNLRGAHVYSSLIRKTEPKPLRVFVQDGRADQNIYAGNWWVANQDMASALEYAGYDTTFVVGTEGHNGRHGSAILPEAMRWLWRDYPKPIATNERVSERHEVRLIVAPGQGWELVGEGYKSAESIAADADGNVYFADVASNRIHRIGADGKVAVFKENSGGARELTVGPDNRLYAVQPGRKRIMAFDLKGGESVVVEGVVAGDLVVARDGSVYFTEPAANRVSVADAKKAKRVMHEGIASPASIGLSADQSLLYVSQGNSKWVWSFQVQKDGSIAHGQPFYRMERQDEDSADYARGLVADTDGYMYAATELGIQVCDQAGRVTSILNAPSAAQVTGVGFGGSGLQTLYVTARDKVYKRQLRRKGVLAGTPVKPPMPRL